MHLFKLLFSSFFCFILELPQKTFGRSRSFGTTITFCFKAGPPYNLNTFFCAPSFLFKWFFIAAATAAASVAAVVVSMWVIIFYCSRFGWAVFFSVWNCNWNTPDQHVAAATVIFKVVKFDSVNITNRYSNGWFLFFFRFCFVLGFTGNHHKRPH